MQQEVADGTFVEVKRDLEEHRVILKGDSSQMVKPAGVTTMRAQLDEAWALGCPLCHRTDCPAVPLRQLGRCARFKADKFKPAISKPGWRQSAQAKKHNARSWKVSR